MRKSSPSAVGPVHWLDRFLADPLGLAIWCTLAAFGTYACMYGFRKPFTAGTYVDAPFGPGAKAWLVGAQVLGYTLSKIIGIRVISEMNPARRRITLLGLIAFAEVALLLFAVVPAPFHTVCLFFNGLPLGLVFGLVLGFLEGRRLTEAFVAGLCASFILADGIAKSAGATLLAANIPEPWMPAVAGLMFALPLLGFVWMLGRIPAPDAADVIARSERTPLDAAGRRAFLGRHGAGLILITLAYTLITVLRSFRADFAPELWAGLGTRTLPGLFTRSEMWVALAVIGVNALTVRIRDNRTAFFASIGVACAGLCLVAVALVLQSVGNLQPFTFMVLLGIGLYLPYVAVHTTVFERLIAFTRETGNIGFLMYLADAGGYLGYVGVMLVKNNGLVGTELLPSFIRLSWAVVILAALAFIAAAVFFARRHPAPSR
jgi:hypothetical protein